MSIAHIALACAIGAGLGFHLSWQVAPEFWRIGALLGGAGAFLTAAAPQLPAAIRRGWQRTINDLPLERVKLRYSAYSLICSTVMGLAVMAFINLYTWLVLILAWITNPILSSDDYRLISWFWLSALAFSWLVSWMAVRLLSDTLNSDKAEWEIYYRGGGVSIDRWCHRIDRERPELVEFFQMSGCLFLGSALLPLFLIAIISYWLWLAVKNASRGGRFISRLVRNVFRFIHEAQPLLCFVDAGLAVVIAHLLLTPNMWGDMAAMGLGGTIGVLHFEIVSVRWLKLANQPTD